MKRLIFDCDGVLIDSEPVAAQLLHDEVAALGWRMSEGDAQGLMGLTWSGILPVIERRIGRALPADWIRDMQDKLVARLEREARAMPGAADLLSFVVDRGIDYVIASNSSHREMQVKFAVTGLTPLVAGRLFSASDVPRGKPAPDLFLAAAGCVPPAQCLVVEDSLPGITAAHAAGMAVVVLQSAHGLPSLPCTPLAVIQHLDQLRSLLVRVKLGEAA